MYLELKFRDCAMFVVTYARVWMKGVKFLAWVEFSVFVITGSGTHRTSYGADILSIFSGTNVVPA
jgi:hypothetical protein